ncbi:MAG: TetR/AcrR family transcriptional regulator [Rhodobacteraceae bacterium]|nr:TetR/AcrR family transcriptional regulator [Paracoccaceae bacterium]
MSLKPNKRGPVSSKHRRRLSLEELTQEARDAIFAAAGVVVGQYGYSGASIKRITEEAGIAQGTFYLYFDSRQSLFDTLLPHAGSDMLRFIRKRVQGACDIYEMEERGFRAFFEYLQRKPGFIRILNEAESAAPVAYSKHFRMLGEHYHKALMRGVARGEIRNFDSDELETVTYMLMAARSYIYLRYLKDEVNRDELPEKVVQAYMKLIRDGLR